MKRRSWGVSSDLVLFGRDDGGFTLDENFDMCEIREYIRRRRKENGWCLPVLPLEPWLLAMALDSLELGFDEYAVAKMVIEEEKP